MSEGWVAMQEVETPRMPRSRCPPLRAGQPDPGARLLHGLLTSWKYAQRVFCRRFPAVLALLRSCPDAPARMLSDSTGKRARTTGSPATAAFVAIAPMS